MSRNMSDEKTEKGGGLFDDLSLAQVAAGALAAVTSMLLASQIGIYGSVIGVGVGSVVSAVASQLYKKFLQRSADKLREIKPGETLAMTKMGRKGAPADEGAEKVSGAPESASADAPTAAIDPGKTAVLPPASRRMRTPRLDDDALQDDVTVRRARALRARKRRLKRGVVAVSVVSALIAVAVSAFIVDAVSGGQGVGVKTAPLITAPRFSPSDEAVGGGEGSTGAQDGSPEEASGTDSKGPETNGSVGEEGAGADSPSRSASGSKPDTGSSSGGSDGSTGSGSGATPDEGTGGSTGPDGQGGAGGQDDAEDGSGSAGDAGTGGDADSGSTPSGSVQPSTGTSSAGAA